MTTVQLRSLHTALAVLSLFVLLASCGRGEGPARDLRVESSSPLSAEPINEALLIAAGRGEAWALDPVRIALESMGSQGARSVKIEREDERGEAPRSATVTVIEDGYLDDSLRGSWTRFTMKRQDDGTWRVESIQKAYRCWRGHSQESYSARPCP